MTSRRWSAHKARAWYAGQPMPCGINYVPNTAVNSTEMWQAETFDPATTDRELGWAEALGLNCCRVFLPFLVWQDDPDGMLHRFAQWLGIADAHGLSTIPCLFDDCAFSGRDPSLGPQPAPVPGVHNSGWTPSPGHARVTDSAAWPELEAYVTGFLTRFAADRRVLLWDLYNEPGNAGMNERSLPLVREAFRWARAVHPKQPLTVGMWNDATTLNALAMAHSDVITFHHYGDLALLEQQLAALRPLDRPLLCTEWMHRTIDCRCETHLPFFHRNRIGWLCWGLVNGRTQTHFPWNSPAGAPEPAVWQHDLLHSNGRPYCWDEAEVIRRYTTPIWAD